MILYCYAAVSPVDGQLLCPPPAQPILCTVNHDKAAGVDAVSLRCSDVLRFRIRDVQVIYAEVSPLSQDLFHTYNIVQD